MAPGKTTLRPGGGFVGGFRAYGSCAFGGGFGSGYDGGAYVSGRFGSEYGGGGYGVVVLEAVEASALPLSPRRLLRPADVIVAVAAVAL